MRVTASLEKAGVPCEQKTRFSIHVSTAVAKRLFASKSVLVQKLRHAAACIWRVAQASAAEVQFVRLYKHARNCTTPVDPQTGYTAVSLYIVKVF